MAIRGIKPTQINGIIGKNTDDNLATMEPQYATIAKNVVFRGDGLASKCPGYTQVQQLASGAVKRIYDYQRSVDSQQFVIAQRGSILSWFPAAGGTETSLSATEDATATFSFVQNYFNLYGSNGKVSYRFVDKAGVLTKYQWGLTAAPTAPTIATGVGTLTLTFGRQYVVCPVSYYTDSTGVQRMHIGAPSPLSAHTGPQVSKVITVGGIPVATDAQVTHWWVFATMDTAFNTTSAYYFAAEITNGTTSWGDTLADSALDLTRLAPWDNKPAPKGDILTTFNNRVVIIDSTTGFIYVSGYEEIGLGIPEESFPSSLFFQIPSGIRKPTAAVTVDSGDLLLISTPDAWYQIQGYDASTLTKKDRVVTPGAVGKKAVAVTPYGVTWLGSDKRLYAWLGTGNPYNVPSAIDISGKLQKKLTGTYAMEDLSDANLSNCEVKWFSFGKNHYIMVFGNTSDQATTGFNWVQLWFLDIDAGQIQSVGESDFIPTDLLGTASIVTVGNTPYMFLGDAATGAIYRWPDGFTHNGQKYAPVFAPIFSRCDTEAAKRFMWADVATTRTDSQVAFKFKAWAGDAPDPDVGVPSDCIIAAVPAGYGNDPETFRANLQNQGTSIGRYIRPLIIFPDDNADAAVEMITIYSKPLYLGAP